MVLPRDTSFALVWLMNSPVTGAPISGLNRQTSSLLFWASVLIHSTVLTDSGSNEFFPDSSIAGWRFMPWSDRCCTVARGSSLLTSARWGSCVVGSLRTKCYSDNILLFIKVKRQQLHKYLGQETSGTSSMWPKVNWQQPRSPVTAALHRLLPQLSYRDWFTLQEQSINPWSFSFTPIKSFFLHDNIHFLAEWILSYGILSEAAQKVETKDQQM